MHLITAQKVAGLNPAEVTIKEFLEILIPFFIYTITNSIFLTLRNMSIIKWHKNQVNSICKRLGISAYGALWVSFLKGVIIGSTLIYLLN